MNTDENNQVWTPRERETWLTLLRAFTRVHQHLCAEMERQHATPMAWYDVLVTLKHHCDEDGCMQMQHIAEHIMMSTSGLTRLIDRMVEANLVQRSRADDRRVVHISLTNAGEQKLAELQPAHQKRVQAVFLQYLQPEEMQAIITGCQRVLDNFTADNA
ncbi:MAG: MarR family transcriptional regulator [Chloroflexota bacterium]